jgi:hypothetical protein
MSNSDTVLKLNHKAESVPPSKEPNEILGFFEKPTVTYSVAFDIDNVLTQTMAKMFAVAVMSALAANKVRLVDIEMVLGRRAVITFMVPLHMKVIAVSDSVQYAIYTFLRTFKED